MSDPVEQGEQVADLAATYDDVALAGMVLELRERVRLLEQRVDDLSTAEQGEIEASKKAARAYRKLEAVEQREKGLRDRVEDVREQMSGLLREKLWEALAASPPDEPSE